MKWISKNVAETESIAAEFVRKLSAEKNRDALIVGLSGDLGSGKTTFVQMVARALGVKENVTSPTFVIMKYYSLSSFTLNPKPYTLLVHIDAYRLKSGEELMRLGFKELLADQKNLILIEWPEHVSSVLPRDSTTIYFKFVNETTRTIEAPNL